MFDLAHHLVTTTDLTSHLSVIAPDHGLSFIHINFIDFNIADLHSSLNTHLIAQEFKQDIMSDIGKSWANFVKTGQIWALLVGLIVGYLFKTLTSY
jgi:hypothetical protein